MADLVLTTCASLASHCEQWTNRTHLFPAGVNLDAFPRSKVFKRADFSEYDNAFPQDLKPALEHKLRQGGKAIGYVGGIHRFMDQELIAGLANLRPEWSFIFVGPEQAPTVALQELRNVFLLGARPHSELASYLQYFDACLIPYKTTDDTVTIVPVKLNEYLAAGKPVISTRLPTVSRFNEKHGVLTLSDAEPVAFVNAIESELQDDSALEIHRRREIAELSSYDVRLEEISTLICRSFAQDQQTEFPLEMDVEEACLTKSR
jgi:glycosyltransferase involved in cell wall biosynthesis